MRRLLEAGEQRLPRVLATMLVRIFLPMAQFVLLIDGAGSEQLEQILRLESESDGHLRYIPVESGIGGLTTRAAVEEEMRASTSARSEVYRDVRIEWDDFGVAKAIQVLELFPFRSAGG